MLSKSLRFGRLASQLATRNMHMKQAAMQFRYMPSVQIPQRMFSDAVLQKTDENEDMSIDQTMGVDETFDEEKHAYVLTFPWNFEEVIQEFDTSS